MLDLIRAVIVVLDEFGVSHGRAKQAVRCASEGLMIVRHFQALSISCLLIFS